MISCLPASDIERFLEEDVPYGDLTTHLLGIGDIPGRISFTTRDATTLCGTEEAAAVFRQCGAKPGVCVPSGTQLTAGREFLTAEGPARALHAGWKVALNLLEYASGIASRTGRIVATCRAINPALTVVTTRKSCPGTKRLAIKAVTAGGALPHRLGLSETLLAFRQHTSFLGGLDTFLGLVEEIRSLAPETKLVVEADTLQEALSIARYGVDIVQVDKMSPALLAQAVPQLRIANPHLLISAAGGITEANCAEYAATGIDIMVLSSVYFGTPSDIGVTLQPMTIVPQ